MEGSWVGKEGEARDGGGPKATPLAADHARAAGPASARPSNPAGSDVAKAGTLWPSRLSTTIHHPLLIFTICEISRFSSHGCVSSAHERCGRADRRHAL